MPSNVSVAQINMWWITLGQNLGRKRLTDVSQLLTRSGRDMERMRKKSTALSFLIIFNTLCVFFMFYLCYITASNHFPLLLYACTFVTCSLNVIWFDLIKWYLLPFEHNARTWQTVRPRNVNIDRNRRNRLSAMSPINKHIHCESKKLCHFYFYCNFGKCWSIFKILSMSESERNGS